ncbi:hypothetical protein E1281_04135 [Actinomadura sp. KC345]|uniref:hypothetical protein n=1 Tax=Actinomadura sp. KC345 TaxID=2530371 RepID=UPI0010430C73|nr:hypothetical protein [Actinomadura sp. KC345]TDC57615.1 hypothetical protein E1281_04135 [Actinomadura sp. KC345]
MSGTTPRRRHGLAGLLAILFVVGGLIFSYGLGHAPVPRVCTEHAVNAPLSTVWSFGGHQSPGGHQAPETAVSPLQGLHGLAGTAPVDEPPHGPAHASMCLAALFTLFLLGLAAGPGRAVFRLPARAGWILAVPSGAAHVWVLRPSLQVLRL